MSIVVSGGTGFIGRHLLHRLAGSGETVHALVRPHSDTTVLPAGIVLHRIDEAADLASLLAGLNPETCFHLATRYQHAATAADIPALLQANLGFATALADAASRSGCRAFVNTGTASQINVDGAYAPASLYAASKQAFEDILAYFAHRAGLPAATVLLYDTYGPGDTRNKLLAQMIAAAKSGQRMALSPGEQEIDLVHVEDVVDGLLAAAGALRAGASTPVRYTLSSGQPLSLRALAEEIARAGKPVPADWGARPYRDGEVMQTWKGGMPPPDWQPRRRLAEYLHDSL